jgi:hypothetical protein
MVKDYKATNSSLYRGNAQIERNGKTTNSFFLPIRNLSRKMLLLLIISGELLGQFRIEQPTADS